MGRHGTIRRGKEFGAVFKSFKTRVNSPLINGTITSLFLCVAVLKRKHYRKEEGRAGSGFGTQFRKKEGLGWCHREGPWKML